MCKKNTLILGFVSCSPVRVLCHGGTVRFGLGAHVAAGEMFRTNDLLMLGEVLRVGTGSSGGGGMIYLFCWVGILILRRWIWMIRS